MASFRLLGPHGLAYQRWIRRRRDEKSTAVLLVVLCLSGISFAMLQSMLNPVLPVIQAEVGTSQTAVTWLVTAYLLSAAVCTPIMGRAGDRFGKRRLLVGALGALTMGSVLAAVAENIGLLIAARLVQGIGGGVMPLVFGIVRDGFPPRRVGHAIGVSSAVLGLGNGLGLVLAGPITMHLGYEYLFWLSAWLTALAMLGAYLCVPDSPELLPGRIDLVAATLMSVWLVAILLAVSQGDQWGWSSSGIHMLLAGGCVSFAAWSWVEWHARSPLIDLRLMRTPTIWRVNVFALLFGAGFYSVMAVIPQYLQASRGSHGLGITLTEATLVLLPHTSMSFVVGLAVGRMSLRFGARSVLLAGAVMSAVAYTVLALSSQNVVAVVVSTTMLGAALGLAYATMSQLVVEAVPRTQTGVAAGVNANFRTLGGALGTAMLMAVITAGSSETGSPTSDGYLRGFVGLAVVAVIGIVIALTIPRPSSLPRLSRNEVARRSRTVSRG